MISADEALTKLKEGNKRFINDVDEHPHNTAQWRQSVKDGQHPFAAVLCCADSRVNPELIFDQGIGDLFEIEVAGNVLGEAVLGSLLYPVAHLGTKLILVMGHQSCGAVGAAVKGEKGDDYIDYFVDTIRPAVEEAKKLEGDVFENAVKINAMQVAERLQNDPAFSRIEGLKIVPAFYSFDTGEVEILD